MQADTIAAPVETTPKRRRRHRGEVEQPVEAALVPDALLTVYTVAKLYGLSPRTIMDKARRGEIPAPRKMGRRWVRWVASDITGHLRRMSQIVPPAHAAN